MVFRRLGWDSGRGAAWYGRDIIRERSMEEVKQITENMTFALSAQALFCSSAHIRQLRRLEKSRLSTNVFDSILLDPEPSSRVARKSIRMSEIHAIIALFTNYFFLPDTLTFRPQVNTKLIKLLAGTVALSNPSLTAKYSLTCKSSAPFINTGSTTPPSLVPFTSILTVTFPHPLFST